MTHAIALQLAHFQSLDLTPAQQVIDPLTNNADDLKNPDLTFSFEIDFPREASDPRELSEIPEVRLWFIRLNSQYPWLPLYLDWESGELSRYTAMLVPHQFSPIDGIRYNPEALEIFVMSKVFSLDTWL
ncbi:MAG: CRR6 family NdhI maturation factor, partial [Cyanobacteria bacterium J06635_11]